VVNFYVLGGDANRDRLVSTTDFNVLAAGFGQFGRSYTQGNFDYSPDGLVDTTDFNILASHFGMSLAPSAAASRAASVTAAPAAGTSLFSTAPIEPVPSRTVDLIEDNPDGGLPY